MDRIPSCILKYRNFNNFAESLSSKPSYAIAQEKRGAGRRPLRGDVSLQYVQVSYDIRE